MLTLKIVNSKKAISPIMAILLLIIIAGAAIVITYVWITNYMSSATQKAGFIPYKANVNFIDDAKTKKTAIDVDNSGTSSGQIVQVCIGTSATTTQRQITTSQTPITIAAGAIESFNIIHIWSPR